MLCAQHNYNNLQQFPIGIIIIIIYSLSFLICSLYIYLAGYIIKTEKTFKNEQRSKDVAAKKTPTTNGVGKINNYYEDIYIPPYNNTDSPHLYIVTIPIDSTH